MDDQSEADAAIDAYKAATVELIAEAEASGKDAIKSYIPDLENTLERLETSDQTRAQRVIEARNLIRTLEQNSESIAFFIRVGEVERAAGLIEQNIAEFSDLVENGKEFASGLTPAANP